MVNIMLNKKVYKNVDISDNSYINIMNSYFNPYEYNFESNLKDQSHKDLENFKTKSHIERNRLKK